MRLRAIAVLLVLGGLEACLAGPPSPADAGAEPSVELPNCSGGTLGCHCAEHFLCESGATCSLTNFLCVPQDECIFGALGCPCDIGASCAEGSCDPKTLLCVEVLGELECLESGERCGASTAECCPGQTCAGAAVGSPTLCTPSCEFDSDCGDGCCAFLDGLGACFAEPYCRAEPATCSAPAERCLDPRLLVICEAGLETVVDCGAYCVEAGDGYGECVKAACECAPSDPLWPRRGP